MINPILFFSLQSSVCWSRILLIISIKNLEKLSWLFSKSFKYFEILSTLGEIFKSEKLNVEVWLISERVENEKFIQYTILGLFLIIFLIPIVMYFLIKTFCVSIVTKEILWSSWSTLPISSISKTKIRLLDYIFITYCIFFFFQ